MKWNNRRVMRLTASDRLAIYYNRGVYSYVNIVYIVIWLQFGKRRM